MSNQMLKYYKSVVRTSKENLAKAHPLNMGGDLSSFVTHGGSYMQKCLRFIVYCYEGKMVDMVGSTSAFVKAVLEKALVGKFIALTTDH